MSYRDLRNFTEMMRALGYPRLISMENFRSPNFSLVAEILIWLIQRLDEKASIHTEYDTEEDRVLLIRSVAQFMALKVHIKLNTRKLYQADGYAVKELLKITTLLHEAMSACQKKFKFGERNQWHELSLKFQELKHSRELTSRVIGKGAVLHELLGKEVELRELRMKSVNNQFELTSIESALKGLISETKENIVNTKSLAEKMSASETVLDEKIEKKTADLERNEKRLQTLKKVRPAFQEEYEKLEVELEGLYQEYVTRLKNLAFLERQQEEQILMEQEKLHNQQLEARKLMEEIQMEDVRKLMEDDDVVGSPEKEAQQQPKPVENRRLRTATAVKPRMTNGHRRVFGGMNIPDDDDSIDSDSDLLLDDDGENSDFMESGDEINILPIEKNDSPQSDDDF